MKKIVLSYIIFMGLTNLGYAESIAPVGYENTEETTNYTDGGLYVGVSYTRPSHDVDFLGSTTASEMDFDGASLQVGYKFNPYVSVEGRYVMTFSDPKSYGEQPTDAEITVWGIYVKPTYPLAPEFDVYALLGYASTEATGSFINAQLPSFTVDEGAFSWGLGGKYILTETISVYADYLLYYDDSSSVYDQVIDSINFGISYQF